MCVDRIRGEKRKRAESEVDKRGIEQRIEKRKKQAQFSPSITGISEFKGYFLLSGTSQIDKDKYDQDCLIKKRLTDYKRKTYNNGVSWGHFP